MASIWDQLLGGTGRTIDVLGRSAGNILPEFGLSEKLETRGAQSIPTEQRVARVQQDPRFGDIGTSANVMYPTQSQVPDQPLFGFTPGGVPQNPPAPDQTGQTGGSGGIVAGAQTTNLPPQQTGQEDLNQILGDLEGQYNQYVSQFGSQAQAEAEAGKQEVEAEGAKQTTQVKGEQKTAMNLARQLYGELTGQASAKLSSLGASSSSAAEAFSERIGRQYQSQLAQLQNAAQTEIGNINEFVRQKKSQLDLGVQSAINNLRNSLFTRLGEMRADERIQALRDYRNQQAELTNARALADMELENYKQRKAVEVSSKYQRQVQPIELAQQYAQMAKLYGPQTAASILQSQYPGASSGLLGELEEGFIPKKEKGSEYDEFLDQYGS